MEQKLHLNVIRYWQVSYGLQTFKWILISCMPLIIRAFWLPAWGWLIMISCLAITFFFIKGLAFICFGVYRKYSRRSYLLGDDELMIRWGNVWSDNSSIIPLSRVQHVDQEQDMLAKRLGLSELTITTAGDHHYIVGLTEEDASRLRRQINNIKIEQSWVYRLVGIANVELQTSDSNADLSCWMPRTRMARPSCRRQKLKAKLMT